MPLRRVTRIVAMILAGSLAGLGISGAAYGQSGVPPADAGVTPPVSVFLESAPWEGAEPLPLETAIAQALQRNPDLMARYAAVDVARERPAQERALMPPMLGVQIWQWPVSSLDPRNTGGYMVMAEQLFPGRGKRALRERAAAAEIPVMEYDVAADARMVVEAVTQAYTELALARASADVYRANLGLLRQLADSAQARYAVGHVAQSDVLQPVVEISRIYDRLIEEEERAGVAEARLNRWMGRPVQTPIGAVDRLEDRRLVVPVAELQRLALTGQPALQASTADIDRASAMLAVADADYRPDFSVQGGYMIMPREGDRWTAQAAITWPRAPWARRGVDARVAEARQAVAAARARHAALENEILLAVQEAYVRVKTAERRIELLRTSIVPQIEQTFGVVRAAYRNNRAELLTVIDTQRLLLDTSLEQVQATATFSSALAELARAVGTDLGAHLVTALPTNNRAGQAR
jgi:outer membrane protein, heavy metal efflux system